MRVTVFFSKKIKEIQIDTTFFQNFFLAFSPLFRNDLGRVEVYVHVVQLSCCTLCAKKW